MKNTHIFMVILALLMGISIEIRAMHKDDSEVDDQPVLPINEDDLNADKDHELPKAGNKRPLEELSFGAKRKKVNNFSENSCAYFEKIKNLNADQNNLTLEDYQREISELLTLIKELSNDKSLSTSFILPMPDCPADIERYTQVLAFTQQPRELEDLDPMNFFNWTRTIQDKMDMQKKLTSKSRKLALAIGFLGAVVVVGVSNSIANLM